MLDYICPPRPSGFDLSDEIAPLTEHRLSDAPEHLARLYGPLVFKAAYRVLGDASMAEDVQQDVFLRLLETRPGAVEAWPAWLSAAATRAAIDVLRRRHRWRRMFVHPSDVAEIVRRHREIGRARLVVEGERAERLRAALATLPRREAQCFGLRYLQGLEIVEIAQALSMRQNNVNVVLHRARRRLEAQLGDAAPEVQA